MKSISWLLFPFSKLYGWITRVRNTQFDNGKRPITHFDRVVISVGNLSVGGTGKTPMIEYLIRLLKSDYSTATLSRGYGRKTRGFRLVNDEDDATTVGDEPLQFYKKYGEEIAVTVGEERILAVPSLLLEKPETELFLLDDAYQHRKVGRDVNILLSDYNNPFYEDHVMPMGWLREERTGANRADCVVITKAPELSDHEKSIVQSRVAKYARDVQVYFSHIDYLNPKAIFTDRGQDPSKNVIVITGLADPKKFTTQLKDEYNIIKHFKFSDHHNFKSEDLNKILKVGTDRGADLSIITTEKDMVRLLKFKHHPLFKKMTAFYIPIEFKIDNDAHFQEWLRKRIEQKKNLN